jgi:hypothetical protein
MIYQYHLDGRFLRSWSSTQDILKKFNSKSASGLNTCLRGGYDTFANFRWSREKMDALPYPTHPNTLMLLRLQQTPVLECDKPTGALLKEWASIQEATKYYEDTLGQDPMGIRNQIVLALKDEKRTYNKHTWRWKDPTSVPGLSV